MLVLVCFRTFLFVCVCAETVAVEQSDEQLLEPLLPCFYHEMSASDAGRAAWLSWIKDWLELLRTQR
jgi:hypothetical protein